MKFSLSPFGIAAMTGALLIIYEQQQQMSPSCRFGAEGANHIKQFAGLPVGWIPTIGYSREATFATLNYGEIGFRFFSSSLPTQFEVGSSQASAAQFQVARREWCSIFPSPRPIDRRIPKIWPIKLN